MPLYFHFPTHVKTTKEEGARPHGRFLKPKWPSGIMRKSTGDEKLVLAFPGNATWKKRLWHLVSGRFQRPSERVPFSDEGGFVFRKAPFKGTLHEGLKGASPSEGFKGAWRDLKGAWRGLEGGFKGAWRGLEGGLKPSTLKGASRGLEGGLKGASRGLEGGLTLKGA